MFWFWLEELFCIGGQYSELPENLSDHENLWCELVYENTFRDIYRELNFGDRYHILCGNSWTLCRCYKINKE